MGSRFRGRVQDEAKPAVLGYLAVLARITVKFAVERGLVRGEVEDEGDAQSRYRGSQRQLTRAVAGSTWWTS